MNTTTGPVRKAPKIHRCRICLETVTGNFKSLKPSLASTLIDYSKMFTFCVGFQVHFEKPFYPTVLCGRCENELLNVYKFMEKCRATEQTLKIVYCCESTEGADEIYENPHEFQCEPEDDPTEEMDAQTVVEEQPVFEVDFEDDVKPTVEIYSEHGEENSNLDEQLMDILEGSPRQSLHEQDLAKYETESGPDQMGYETEYLIEETETEEVISSTRPDNFIMLEPSEYIVQEEEELEDEQAEPEDGEEQQCEQEDGEEQHTEEENEQQQIEEEESEDLLIEGEERINSNQQEQSDSYEEREYQPNTPPPRTNQSFVKIDAKTGICPICGKKLSVRSMGRHVKNHELTGKKDIKRDTDDANKKFKCTECNGLFKYKVSLSHHMAHQHPPDGKKPEYQCKYCGRVFNVHGSWRHHLRMSHLDDKKYECTVCSKRFLTASKLSVHMSSHNNDQQFQCSLCSKRFNRKTQLRQHETVTHSTVMRETCEICSKPFKTKKYLRQHLIMHTQERNYVCLVCGEKFAQNHVLRSHIHKVHPNYHLPPKGTVVSKKALQRMAQEAVEKEKWARD